MLIENTDMIYRGSGELARVYRGSTIVWEPGEQHDYSQDYLTLYPSANAQEYGGGGVYLHGDGEAYLQYSKNDGPWTVISTGVISATENDVIRLRGYNYNQGGTVNYFLLNITGVEKVEGNVMSLVYGDNFSGQTYLPLSLRDLFSGQTITGGYLCSLVDASNLVLPADNLPNLSSYAQMFKGCINLTKPPKLPALVLGPACYTHMFQDCVSLTTAPILPAQTVDSASYAGMFQGCHSLTFVKCLATSGLNIDGLNNWLTDVSPTGTFVKASGATYPTGGTYYGSIPDGWTVVDAGS